MGQKKHSKKGFMRKMTYKELKDFLFEYTYYTDNMKGRITDRYDELYDEIFGKYCDDLREPFISKLSRIIEARTIKAGDINFDYVVITKTLLGHCAPDSGRNWIRARAIVGIKYMCGYMCIGIELFRDYFVDFKESQETGVMIKEIF